MSGKQRRGGLGRGLGALIPTAPAAGEPRRWPPPICPDDVRRPSARRRRARRRRPTDAASRRTARGSAGDAHEPSAACRRSAPVPGATFADLPGRRDPRRTPSSRGRSSTRTRWPSWPTRSASSACCSRSWSAPTRRRRLRAGDGRAAAARGGGGRARRRSRRSSATTADDAMLRDALLENIHRAQLNPLEEAAAYQQLLEEFGTTHDELAHRIGRSRPQVSNTIRLLNLPLAVQRRVAAGVLSAGHARALLGLDDSRPAGRARRPHRRRGPVGAGHRGAGRRWPAAQRPRKRTRRAPGAADHRAGGGRARPASSPTSTTPGCGSSSAGARAGSPSSSPRSTIWNGSWP